MRGSRAAISKTAFLASLAVGCVDTSKQDGAGPGAAMLDEPEPIVLIDSEPVPDAVRRREPVGPYRWQNVAIKGGGFVTGIVFSSQVPNLIFARTDVGGAYRYSVADARWYPLLDWVGQDDSNLLGIESIALDPTRPERVYVAAGTYLTAGNGALLRSDDFGETWTRHAIGAAMGGNAPGRSMGERLAVDPTQPDRLFFGSRTRGLLWSRDAGETWQPAPGLTARGDDGLGLSVVLPDPTGNLYVGVATLSGPTLFRSRDGAQTFEAVAGAPVGMMPHHAAFASNGLLYFAYNDGPGPSDIERGAIWKLDPQRDEWTDVSPRQAGFGGVAIDASRPGTVMASTIDLWAPDQIFRSMDEGAHWYEIGGRAELDTAGADWLYFGGNELHATGWMGDLEIDPFNRSRALYVTGQGIWWSDDVTNTDAGQSASFSFHNEGLEETVALDLAAPPSGAPLVSALGDIAGFRHDDLERSPSGGMFTDPRFGNTTGLDFAEDQPDLLVRVGTNDGGPRGAVSTDGGATFSPLANEPAGNGAGAIAVSSDGDTWVWSPEGGAPAYSADGGESWSACAGVPNGARVTSDRVSPERFYGVDRRGIYVSDDSGQTFTLTPFELPRGAKLRSVFGQAGHFFVTSATGLYRSIDAATTITRVESVDSALAVGFGRAADDAEYPAVYLSGRVSGSAGIFRSDDAGQSWTRISDDRHQFGWVGFITGDQRSYGRVYLGTGGRGIVYGDPL
jgi:photosystem II stability/assembly factor-like uncharacterized protein